MQELSGVSEAARDLAMARFRMIQPYLEERRSLQLVAAEANLSFRTAQRWVSQYRKRGLAAFVRKARDDRGGRRVVSQKIKEAIEGLALERPPLPIRSISRQVRAFAQSTGESMHSYGTVYDLVREVPNGLLTLAHQGSKAYSESYDLVHRREATRSNAIWQADHAQLGILLVREDGQTSRPWLTIVIDDYSRAVAGYYLGFAPPSSMRTALALRQGIWRKGHSRWHICGIPEILYTDNGSDFTSKHIEQVAVDLKMRLVFSTPGKPQGRGRIERFFRTVNQMFLCELDGYIKRKRQKPSLTLERFEELFQTFLLETYHRRISEEGRPAPSARWEEGGFLPRMPESLEQLDLLLMQEVRARRVRRDGIHFQGLRYLSLTLAAYVGEDVTIRFDPRDMGEIRVFYKDRFLCPAVSAELAGETIPLRDVIRVRNQRRRELSAVLQDRQKMVDSLLQLKKGTAPKEIHANAPSYPFPESASRDTATSSRVFIETIEYNRFVEFCEACRQFRYIGLCYGPPGIGKTLSAVRYSRADQIVPRDRWTNEVSDDLPVDTLLYTTALINTPSGVRNDINLARERVMSIVLNPLRREATKVLEEIRVKDEKRRREIMDKPGCSPCDRPAVDPTYFETYKQYQVKERAVADPTTLILVDEADRLHMNSLEQIRSIFDEGTAGLVLIGMPGIEKRIARFPQFYSRIGFVHEFRPLDAEQVQSLLESKWAPVGVTLPDEQLLPEVIASLIRMSGGNFRLLTRLLTQIERVLGVNDLHLVTNAVVEAARDSLVIGPG